MSTLRVQAKILIAVACGILSWVFCPYGLQVNIGDTSIDILWSTLFPVITAMAFGWCYGLIAGLTGGVFFPFRLWPEDGWANVSTALEYLLLYTALGATKSEGFLRFIPNRIIKIAVVLLVYNLINFSYDLFWFNPILNLNPTFWSTDYITWLPPDLILSFGVKDGINVLTLVFASEILLRLPSVRKLIGLRREPKMRENHKIFFISILIPLFIWVSFIVLAHWLLRDDNALQHEHKSFAL